MNFYVHIPFCLSKCRYCALYSVVGSTRVGRFPELLEREYRLRSDGTRFFPETVYFGGGTPGLLGPDGIGEVVRRLVSAGVDFTAASEWTVELNPSPEITTERLLEKLRSLGVNRISFGAQSLDDSVLASMGRRHNAADLFGAFSLARSCGFDNVGLDLIACYPGVTDSIWRSTLERAVSLAPKHLSVYGLIVEPTTPLSAEISAGKASVASDDAWSETVHETELFLAREGFSRYEISNYALPGFECLHNLDCWRGKDYLGIGPAAASRLGLSRRTNVPDVDGWAEALTAGLMPPAENDEILTIEDDAEERFVYGLRTQEGISPSEFATVYPAACSRVEKWKNALSCLEKQGITEQIDAGRWVLTDRGREVADSAIAELL